MVELHYNNLVVSIKVTWRLKPEIVFLSSFYEKRKI